MDPVVKFFLTTGAIYFIVNKKGEVYEEKFM